MKFFLKKSLSKSYFCLKCWRHLWLVDSVEQPIRIYQNSRAESSPKRQKYDLTSCFFENTLPLLQKYICNVYIQRRQKYLLLKLLFVYIVSYLFTISRTRRYVGNIWWQKKSCEKLNFTSFFLVYKCVVGYRIVIPEYTRKKPYMLPQHKPKMFAPNCLF